MRHAKSPAQRKESAARQMRSHAPNHIGALPFLVQNTAVEFAGVILNAILLFKIMSSLRQALLHARPRQLKRPRKAQISVTATVRLGILPFEYLNFTESFNANFPERHIVWLKTSNNVRHDALICAHWNLAT